MDQPTYVASFNFSMPVSIELHQVTTLEPPYTFTAESTCLLGMIMKMGSGYPEKCVFAKKGRVETGVDGWKRHYDGTFRPFMLPDACAQITAVTHGSRTRKTAVLAKPSTEVDSSDDEGGQSPIGSDVSAH